MHYLIINCGQTISSPKCKQQILSLLSIIHRYIFYEYILLLAYVILINVSIMHLYL